MPEITARAEALPSTRIEPEKLSHLSAEQKQQFLTLLEEFAYVFSERPGLCKVGQHETHVSDDFKPKSLKHTECLRC